MVEPGDSRVPIQRLKTGIDGLDTVLGGGLPALSFSLVAGGPGTGKTTLVQQFLFANASDDRPALFITVLGEPTVKLLRYQQQFEFFDIDRVGRDVHFANFSDLVLTGDLDSLFQAIIVEVTRLRPAFVVVDSFRAIARVARGNGKAELENFVQRLANQLTTWEVTSFLIGEANESERDNPVFTVADTILWLTQAVERNSVVRKVQVVKVRGQDFMPGLHTFRMTHHGLEVFPRLLDRWPVQEGPRPAARLSTGIRGLDEMTGGGIPSGDVVLVAGPTGSAKTTFGMQFVIAGLRVGEAAVVAVFEERPREYLARAASLGGDDFATGIHAGRCEVLYLRPLDLSVDETMQALRAAVTRLGATRLVIDSLSGFEVALAPTFRNDFRESLYRLLSMLTSTGVTVMMTHEVVGSPTDPRLTRDQMSFLCDDIILNRFIEIDSAYRRVVTVLKMRRGHHSREIRTFDITSQGVEVGPTLPSYRGLSSGMPVYAPRARPEVHGLTAREADVVEALARMGECTVAALREASGLDAQAFERVMARLIELGFAALRTEGDAPRYISLGRLPP